MKILTLRWSEGIRSMLRAAKSRWVRPRSAMCSIPSAICPHIVIRWATDNGGSRLAAVIVATLVGPLPPLIADGVGSIPPVARRNVLRSPWKHKSIDWWRCHGTMRSLMRSLLTCMRNSLNNRFGCEYSSTRVLCLKYSFNDERIPVWVRNDILHLLMSTIYHITIYCFGDSNTVKTGCMPESGRYEKCHWEHAKWHETRSICTSQRCNKST